jgi:hypothetical protein
VDSQGRGMAGVAEERSRCHSIVMLVAKCWWEGRSGQVYHRHCRDAQGAERHKQLSYSHTSPELAKIHSKTISHIQLPGLEGCCVSGVDRGLSITSTLSITTFKGHHHSTGIIVHKAVSNQLKFLSQILNWHPLTLSTPTTTPCNHRRQDAHPHPPRRPRPVPPPVRRPAGPPVRHWGRRPGRVQGQHAQNRPEQF